MYRFISAINPHVSIQQVISTQHSPGSSTIEMPSALAESGFYSPDRGCHSALARAAAPYQASRNSAACLSCATFSQRHQIGAWEEVHRVDNILNQPSRRRVSTNRLNHVHMQLVISLKGESHPTPAGKTLPHSCPKTRFRRDREHKVPWYTA